MNGKRGVKRVWGAPIEVLGSPRQMIGCFMSTSSNYLTIGQSICQESYEGRRPNAFVERRPNGTCDPRRAPGCCWPSPPPHKASRPGATRPCLHATAPRPSESSSAAHTAPTRHTRRSILQTRAPAPYRRDPAPCRRAPTPTQVPLPRITHPTHPLTKTLGRFAERFFLRIHLSICGEFVIGKHISLRATSDFPSTKIQMLLS